jgi:hypothetical protein
VVLAGVGVGRQLGTLARLEDAEDDGADEGSYELRYCLVDCWFVLAIPRLFSDITDRTMLPTRDRFLFGNGLLFRMPK